MINKNNFYLLLMQSLPQEKENELNFALEMYKLGYLPGPLKCKYGNINFSI